MYSSTCIVLLVISMTNSPNLATPIGLPRLTDAHTSVHSDASSTYIIDSSSSRATSSSTSATAAAAATNDATAIAAASAATTPTTTTTFTEDASDAVVVGPSRTSERFGSGVAAAVSSSDLLQPTLPNIVGDLSEDYDTLERRRRIQVGLCEVACIKKV